MSLITLIAKTMEILLFGITKDIISKNKISLADAAPVATVGELKVWLLQQYAGIGNLSSLAVAVNKEYAEDETPLQPGDEIALIPPVSGG